MTRFSRKVQRQSAKVADSETELRCDLIEAWMRKHGSVGVVPGPLLLSWMADLLESGLPGVKPEQHWPALYETLYELATEFELMGTPDFDIVHAGCHVLGALVGTRIWAQSGYPTLRIDDQLASALMLTDSSKAELSEDIPWRAFMVKVPPQTLQYRYRTADKNEQVTTYVESLLVAKPEAGGTIMLTLIGAEPSLPFCVAWARSLDGLLAARESWVEHGVIAEMAVNLVRGALLQIQAGKLQPLQRSARKGGHRWRRPGDLPETTDYILGTDVRLRREQDFVAAAKTIAAGTKRYGKVQWMVRGHQRWQACGPRHSERKLILVPPFWKGPVGAPILRRDHVIEGSGES